MTKHLDIDTKAMRAKILDLAIRGKLTDQRHEDGNARDLLKAIQAEKERLIKEKKIKKEKPLPEITEGEKPFDIPDNWEWVRLGDIAQAINGDRGKNYPKREEYVSSGIAWINTGHITDDGYLNADKMNYITRDKYDSLRSGKIQRNDLLFCLRGSFGKVARIEPFCEGAIASSLAIIRLFDTALRKYLFIYLKSPQAVNELNKYANGTAQPNLAAKDVLKYLIPLPPLAEQQRIADKVSALFAQLDVIDKAYEKYRELQQAMKAKLLELAMQGKLTDQRDEDGNARDLFQDIKEEKQRLIAEKKIKKEKTLPEIEADETPFEIPKNWMWVRINDLFDVARGGSPRPIKAFLTEDMNGINWIKIGDTEIGGKYIYHVKEKIKPEGLKKSRFVKSGDLLLTNSMSYGRPYILKTDGCIHDGWLVLSPFVYSLNKEFFYYLISSQYVKREFTKTAVGAVVKNLNKNKVKAIIIPLPPLAEQKRIVAKLDELLPLL